MSSLPFDPNLCNWARPIPRKSIRATYAGKPEKWPGGFTFMPGMKVTVEFSNEARCNCSGFDVPEYAGLPAESIAYALVRRMGKRVEVPYTVSGFFSNYKLEDKEAEKCLALLTRTR